jgi:hypothetical protein
LPLKVIVDYTSLVPLHFQVVSFLRIVFEFGVVRFRIGSILVGFQDWLIWLQVNFEWFGEWKGSGLFGQVSLHFL